jgi:LytS/YehU family sensor histidine kinase
MKMIEAVRPSAPRASDWVVLVWVLAVSSVIASLLALMQAPDVTWDDELLASNSIGLSIWGVIRLLHAISGRRLALLPTLFIGVPIGVVIGGKLATLFGVYDFIGAYSAHPLERWKSIGVVALFAASASAFVVVSSNAASYRLALEIEQRRLAEASRSQAVAELALLQAQIEPHFLFNTLAHVQSAIEQDPTTGKLILENLICYLRGTLRRTRNTRHTLTEERNLIEALLNIASIRIGPRLRHHVNIADAIGAAVLPPLLLQPLVENAIKHGIEPAVDGGEITVVGERIDDTLVLRVTDTGVGMGMAGPEGVGLENVRARLASLYGEKGRLTLQPHPKRGVIAELRLPWQSS